MEVSGRAWREHPICEDWEGGKIGKGREGNWGGIDVYMGFLWVVFIHSAEQSRAEAEAEQKLAESLIAA